VRATEAAPALLAAFVKQLEAQGIELPERQYVAPGSIAVWDSEQLAINLQDILRGQPGEAVEKTTWPVPTVVVAQFAVQLVRLVPALSNDGPLQTVVPGEVEIGVSGMQAMDDADAIVEAALAIQQAHTVTEPGMGFGIGQVSTLGPEGGLAAVMLKVTISLD
jgi:hypothetical protein